MDAKEVAITYETLYELLRREKSKEELQKLDPVFFKNVIGYLSEKKGIIDDDTKNDVFSITEREKTFKQLENIKKILRELYERREKKIIETAINKSRTKSDIIDTTNMLDKEKYLFSSIVEVLDKFRTGILINMLNLKEPMIGTVQEDPESTPEIETTEKKTKFVKFVAPVEQFVGEELELYGPFQPQDKAYLPVEIANVLISQENAVEIEEE